VLVELRVRDLGVFDDVTVELGPGMTALTGETGAGKTLLVEALGLLLGGRADPVVVRRGAEEALVEGRFEDLGIGADEGQVMLARAVSATGGRSRAWKDGRMVPVSMLGETAMALVDLYGQHSQQSLFDASAQRRALDTFGDVDTRPLQQMLSERRRITSEIEALGGDERVRARQVDLLQHQIQEIDGAGLADPDEDRQLTGEEERLADSARYREMAAAALGELEDADGTGGTDGADAGAVDRLGRAGAALTGRPALAGLAERLRALQSEAADVASELRTVLDGWDDDPERLAEVRARRQLLRELQRKYGEGVEGVLSFAEQARAELADLQSAGARLAGHAQAMGALESAIAEERAAIGTARRRAAPALAGAVQQRLRALAMAGARLEVQLDEEGPADRVVFLLGANPGEPPLPLSKVASGGELARAMLALRLVLTEAPPTMVFDEVDAGVGGGAAVSVGEALAELAGRHQVLVVTHLPQVAAFADRQLAVRKDERRGRTRATVAVVEGEDRVVELARMLSGRPDSERAKRHAEELLQGAAGAGTLHR